MQVTIKNGSLRGEIIEGTFELAERWTKHYGSQSYHVRDGKIKLMIEGKSVGVQVNREDVTYDSDLNVVVAPQETTEEIAQRINEAFTAMDIFSCGAIAGHIRSLIVSGAAGVGKTFTLERDLKAAEEAGDINFAKVAGTCSAIGLYCKLYEMREEDSVLLLDDVDVFGDEDSMNILKAALDSGEERHISYNKASKWLEEQDIPRDFEFKGTVIFISNKDFDRELQSGTKLAPHYNALISRSVYLDLGVHTIEEIMVRVKQVVASTDMLTSLGLTDTNIADLMDWLDDNIEQLRSLSLRTCLHIADMIKTSPTQWKMLAKMTMLRKGR